MSEGRDDDIRRDEARLHAYHDGELRGFARRRFERALRRSSGLRRELGEIAAIGDSLRAYDAGTATPDLWDDIALRLPALDARRAEGGSSAGRSEGLFWWLKPIGAVAATAAVALVVAYGGLFTTTPATGGAVRWIDSGDRSVMVLDDEPGTTIIWVLDGAVEGASRGGSRARV